MAASVPSPRWSRRVPGLALVVFFVSLIGLTLLAVHSWNNYFMELAGLFTGLASAAPLALLYWFYLARPVWAYPSATDAATVEQAVRRAIDPQKAEAVSERKGVFRFCTSVLRVSDPRCVIGWSQAQGARAPTQSMILIVEHSKDRASLEALRTAIADALHSMPAA